MLYIVIDNITHEVDSAEGREIARRVLLESGRVKAVVFEAQYDTEEEAELNNWKGEKRSGMVLFTHHGSLSREDSW